MFAAHRDGFPQKRGSYTEATPFAELYKFQAVAGLQTPTV
jgi:hypothetical protein